MGRSNVYCKLTILMMISCVFFPELTTPILGKPVKETREMSSPQQKQRDNEIQTNEEIEETVLKWYKKIMILNGNCSFDQFYKNGTCEKCDEHCPYGQGMMSHCWLGCLGYFINKMLLVAILTAIFCIVVSVALSTGLAVVVVRIPRNPPEITNTTPAISRTPTSRTDQDEGPPDYYNPENCPPGQLLIQTTAQPDNCQPGQLLIQTTAQPDNCQLGQLLPQTTATRTTASMDNSSPR